MSETIARYVTLFTGFLQLLWRCRQCFAPVRPEFAASNTIACLLVLTQPATALPIQSNLAASAEAKSQFTVQTDQAQRLDELRSCPIVTAQFQLFDDKRHKEIPVHATFPSAEGHYPVIIFSHGLFGSRDGYGYLVRHWAEHGYICLQPSHEDSASWHREMGKRIKFLSEIRALPHNKQAAINRADDISFVISALYDGKCIAAVQSRADKTSIGVAGHSDGACTSMLIAGAELADAKQPPYIATVRDSRVKAMIAMSPGGVRRKKIDFGFDTIDSFKTISIPSMFLTGDRDQAGPHSREAREDAFRGCPACDKYFLSIFGASHMTFAGRDPSTERVYDAIDKLLGKGYGDQAKQRKLVQDTTTLFWDAYLSDDATAKRTLESDALANRLKDQALFKSK